MRSYTRMFLIFLTFCLVIAYLIRRMLVVVTVNSYSMSPALEDGDRVLVVRQWPRAWLRKGQIVIVWPWQLPPEGPSPFGVEGPFIKRIVGLAGDVLVTSLAELAEIQRPLEAAAHDSNGLRTWQIPSDHIFVRGDHPIGGFDSLAWGPVPTQYVLGVVVMKLPSQRFIDM